MAKIEQAELHVLDQAIHCSGCESRIQAVLSKLPGVIRVKADRKSQRVTVMLDTEKMPLSEVKQKLEAAGYNSA